MFGAIIYYDFDDHTSAHQSCGIGRTVNAVRPNESPFASGSPIAIKISVRVLGVFLRVLPPREIGKVKRVCGLVVLLLKSGEKMVYDALLGPVAVHPCKRGNDEYERDGDRNRDLSPAGPRGIERLSIEQGHPPSITQEELRFVEQGRPSRSANRKDIPRCSNGKSWS